MSYNIEIETNPAGYSDGTYGYIITDGGEPTWFDGGYPDRDTAQQAATDRVRDLTRSGIVDAD